MKEKRGFFRKRKKLIIIFSVVIIIAVIIFFNLQAQREKAIKVTVEYVKKQDLTSTISASGEVKPRKNVNISAHVPGRIVKIGVEEGQEVKENNFLLKLDSTQYEANADRDRALIRSFQAELIKADAILRKDKNFYERQKKLYEEQLISKEQLEAAKAQYEISDAQYKAIFNQIDQAKASLHSTLDNLSKTVYYSPIDGIITSLRVEEGEVAMIGTMNNPGTILMTIADLSVMEIEVEVDEIDVIGVQIGHEAEVRVDAFPEQTIKGKVTEIGSSAIQKITASQESKDFKVVITLENPPEKLKPGLSASADIIIAEKKDVLAVPISAIVLREKDEEEKEKKDEEEEGVYVVQEDRVKFIPVKKGIMGEMMIEIAEGLEEDQQIVVGPYNSLRQLKENSLIKPDEKKRVEE
ncbi:MAG: efflux RND transporter periplasmic adaptor subunit [Candidatus Aminicenantaceae bacterium]